ncbi:hypothetical protein V8E54_003266 [Elaphomyces granulatus]
MERYLQNNVSAQVHLPTTNSMEIKDGIDQAVKRLKIATEDNYDAIGILSLRWISDNTGAILDTKLFVDTVSSLLSTEFGVIVRVGEMMEQLVGRRKLVILHYAGHVVRGCTSNRLELTPRIGQEEETLDFSSIKNMITERALKTSGWDVLFIMDCCCSATGGRDGRLGSRVEFMAPAGISNSRMDGDTFTQDLCKSFEKLSTKKQFTCFDLMEEINAGPERKQYGRVFVLQEGWNLPITFRPKTSLLPKYPSVPATILTCTLVVTLHVKEGPTSKEFKQLVEHLKKAPVPVNILAALPTSSTLLLLLMPASLEYFLRIPRHVL